MLLVCSFPTNKNDVSKYKLTKLMWLFAKMALYFNSSIICPTYVERSDGEAPCLHLFNVIKIPHMSFGFRLLTMISFILIVCAIWKVGR